MNHIQSDIHNISLRKALLFAYQRAVRGYDDRISQGWGFVEYLDVFLEPLKEFCEGELLEAEGMKYDGTKYIPSIARNKVYKKTITLIDEYRAIENLNSFEYDNKEKELWKFIGENIGTYWN